MQKHTKAHETKRHGGGASTSTITLLAVTPKPNLHVRRGIGADSTLAAAPSNSRAVTRARTYMGARAHDDTQHHVIVALTNVGAQGDPRVPIQRHGHVSSGPVRFDAKKPGGHRAEPCKTKARSMTCIASHVYGHPLLQNNGFRMDRIRKRLPTRSKATWKVATFISLSRSVEQKESMCYIINMTF
jgi:hypothetical protein